MNARRKYFALGLALAACTFAWAATEVYFTSDAERSAEKRLVSEIAAVRKTLDGAVFDVTNPALADALTKAKTHGARVRFVVDARQAKGKHSLVRALASGRVEVKILQGRRGGRGVMHHKFALFDGKRLATGSYNWSRGAENYNYENLILTDEAAMIESFQREFDRLWRKN